MVKLNKIYTKMGDGGSTVLATGGRVAKFDVRVAAYGDVDELNATLGVARLSVDPDVDTILVRIQNDLFDLGADLATPGMDGGLRVTDAQVAWLEERIDAVNADLAPLTSFVLPGGTPGSAQLHLARTVCRRAERLVSALDATEGEEVSPAAGRYLNRLSDLLFVLARQANREIGDVLWQPGENR